MRYEQIFIVQQIDISYNWIEKTISNTDLQIDMYYFTKTDNDQFKK